MKGDSPSPFTIPLTDPGLDKKWFVYSLTPLVPERGDSFYAVLRFFFWGMTISSWRKAKSTTARAE